MDVQKTDGLRLKEISLFLDLIRVRSMRELSRQSGLPPGQISKIIRTMERRIGRPLIHRSVNGISLTAYGTEVLPFLESIRNNQLRIASQMGASSEGSPFTIATTSFFSSRFLPDVLGSLEGAQEFGQVQILDLPPSQFLPVALRNGFSVCVHLEDLEWPKTWVSVQVGIVRWSLYARMNHPIFKKPTLKEALKYRFVYPIYWTAEGIRRGNDYFPIPIQRRRRGTETATAIGAAQIVAQSDQLGFLPNLVAQSVAGEISLVDVPVRGLKAVDQKVFLTVKADLVKQKAFDRLAEVCRERLERRLP